MLHAVVVSWHVVGTILLEQWIQSLHQRGGITMLTYRVHLQVVMIILYNDMMILSMLDNKQASAATD